ncbi:MAG: Ku protein [Dermatophilaceae bacterium]
MWKGAVSFGLVNVPVKLYSATENHDISFRQVHREDGGQIRYQRVCSVCGQQVAYEDVAKGYETDDGQMVILTDEDLATLPNQASKEVAVEKFVPADQIDPMLLDRSYYLEPEKGAAKAYALLRDALVNADRMALVTVSIRTRMTMAVLRVRDGIIVLQTMLWPDEVRSADFANLGDVGHATDKELAMATMLVDSLAGDFDPDELEDDYAGAVRELVDSKVSGAAPVPAPAAAAGSGDVVDLLDALQRSVDRAKASRGEPTTPQQPAAPAEAPEAPRAAKPSAPRAPAKKAASTRTPAKKTAAKTAAKRKAS